MDLHFVEPDQAPVPPEQVRVLALHATPLADGRRVKVAVALTPFLERPDVELRILDPHAQTLAEADVIECVDHDFEVTLHLRVLPRAGATCRLQAVVRYPDRGLEASSGVEFLLPPHGG
jgi:hypothetical protein